MADPTTTPTPKTPVIHSAQDQQLANNISEAEDLIDAIRGDAEISALLAAKGYDTAKIDAGDLLQQAADTAFQNRQAALGEKTSSGKDHDIAETTARQAFADYRVIAGDLFEDVADRTTLGLTGRVAKDQQIFITNARAAYKAAGKAPYTVALSKAGYDAAGLTAALATLEAMGDTNVSRNNVGGNAKLATSLRDAACKKMDKWISGLTKVAKVALRDRPDLLAKLKL